ncbi:hypothetical protein QTO34_000352 [Cnephaeus nilssonii]|uniref:Integrase-type domain-containing protein n=1 Tax=Cnephaeus nilssonii TaxID=3371016 RepID=A0AA40IBV1_CNENI|nr:hypothetical protein QTO34_000352 [Eptesicus nilssonii]
MVKSLPNKDLPPKYEWEPELEEKGGKHHREREDSDDEKDVAHSFAKMALATRPLWLEAGNEEVDRLVASVEETTPFSMAQASHALHHQNASALRKKFHISREQARQIVKQCPQCVIHLPVPALGVLLTPSECQSEQCVTTMDLEVQLIPPFKKLKITPPVMMPAQPPAPKKERRFMLRLKPRGDWYRGSVSRPMARAGPSMEKKPEFPKICDQCRGPASQRGDPKAESSSFRLRGPGPCAVGTSLHPSFTGVL